MSALSRVVAVLSIVALLGGCSAKQRTYATYGAVAVSVFGVGWYVQTGLSDCPPHLDEGIDQCEEDRHDRKNVAGIVAIAGLAAAIVAQLWPVPDEPSEADPEPTPIVVAAPPKNTAKAESLRPPAVVKLAENARTFAAAGKCLEAFGSLKALRQLDREFADQLQAWDPTVSRCRSVTGTSAAGTIEVTPGPNGPPATAQPDPFPSGQP